jgi:hypothetical protein
MSLDRKNFKAASQPPKDILDELEKLGLKKQFNRLGPAGKARILKNLREEKKRLEKRGTPKEEIKNLKKIKKKREKQLDDRRNREPRDKRKTMLAGK